MYDTNSRPSGIHNLELRLRSAQKIGDDDNNEYAKAKSPIQKGKVDDGNDDESIVVVTVAETSMRVSSSRWTQVMRMHYQMGSVLKLDVRLYRMTNVGIKVMGSALLDVGSMLKKHASVPNLTQNVHQPMPWGGIIVAEFMMLHQEPSSSLVRFRLQTLRLANPDAQLSDTHIEVSKLEQGIWVKVDRWDRSVLELDTKWNWPIRISLYDSRHGVELGSCVEQLHALLGVRSQRTQPQHLTLRNNDNKVVGQIELTNLNMTHTHPVQSPQSNNVVCVGIDFTSTNNRTISSLDPSPRHTIRPSANNAYQDALSKIAKLFDTHQTYRLWGFGAQLEGKVRHIFQCGTAELVTGAQGLDGAYHSFLTTNPRGINGPKVMSHIIKAAAQKGRLLVLLSDFVGLSITQLKELFQLTPELRIILVAVRSPSRQLQHINRNAFGKHVVFLHAEYL